MSVKVGKRGATRKKRVTYRWQVRRSDYRAAYYTTIRHINGNVTFDGSEMYSRKIDARRSVQNLIAAIQDGRIEEQE